MFGQAMLNCHIHTCLIALRLLHMHFKISAYNVLGHIINPYDIYLLGVIFWLA